MCQSTYLSLSLSIQLSILLFVYLSIYTSTYIYIYISLSLLNLAAGLFTSSTPASHSEISENLISIMKEPAGSKGGAQSAPLAGVNIGRAGGQAERRAAARSDGRSIA